VTAGLDHAPERRLADAFAAGAAALAHVRADPLLPAALGPSTEAGDALRAAYRAYEAQFSEALRAWFRAHA
jgi:DNA-binding transcriptional regulator PaaX